MLPVVAAVAAFFLHCMGGGVNTGNARSNALTGRVVEWNGVSPSQSVISLYNAYAIPPVPPQPDTNRLRSTSPDPNGSFRFENIPLGTYNIIGQDTIQKTATIKKSVVIADTVDTVVDVGADTLTKMTSIAGMVHRLPPGYSAFCYVTGSPFYILSGASLDTAANFILAGLPSQKLFDIQVRAIPPSSLGKTCVTALYLQNGLPDTLTFEPIAIPCPLP
jgi:hypothetical protein